MNSSSARGRVPAHASGPARSSWPVLGLRGISADRGPQAPTGVACAAVGVVSRDPDQTVDRLGTWLTDVAGLPAVTVDHLEIPGSTGFSNETILFDATWNDERTLPRLVPEGLCPL